MLPLTRPLEYVIRWLPAMASVEFAELTAPSLPAGPMTRYRLVSNVGENNK
jgi:hypothetical protein